MGQYQIEIIAVGTHGCSRQTKDGDPVYGCRHMDCPDCQAREFIRQLISRGSSVEAATFTHWPGQSSEVKDDLVTTKRSGNF